MRFRFVFFFFTRYVNIFLILYIHKNIFQKNSMNNIKVSFSIEEHIKKFNYYIEYLSLY